MQLVRCEADHCGSFLSILETLFRLRTQESRLKTFGSGVPMYSVWKRDGSGFERSDQPHAIRNARTVSLNDNAHVYRFVGRELKPLERPTNASSPGESGRAELGKERKSSRFYKSLATSIPGQPPLQFVATKIS